MGFMMKYVGKHMPKGVYELVGARDVTDRLKNDKKSWEFLTDREKENYEATIQFSKEVKETTEEKVKVTKKQKE